MYNDIIFSAYKNDDHYIMHGNYMGGFSGFLTNFGNGFLLPNGIFTAPRTGIYEFSVDAHAYSTNIAILTVQHNGANELSFHTQNVSYGSLSFSWIMELKQDDTVRIYVQDGYVYCGDVYNCVFSGKLIKN